ncbi:MAG TPA: TIR domain-containing protein [Methanoregula sp.]|nr:TIR domain-containing protein [Methanoregula sp.]
MISDKQWDVFISHATEDKPIARQIAVKLNTLGYTVWYDEWTLKIGDRLFSTINKGLANSRYGVVLLSKNFFNKDWPQKELGGLVELEKNGKKVILPIWHEITRDEIETYSPILADLMAAQTKNGIDSVVTGIVEVLGPIDEPIANELLPPPQPIKPSESRDRKITLLLQTLRDDYDDKKRNSSARELRTFNEPRVVDALLDAVEHDAKVRYEALVSLFELKSEKSIDSFVHYLEDRSGRIRHISIRALGEMGRESAIKPLMSLIFSYDHHNWETKRPRSKGWTNNWGKTENVQAAKDALGRILHRLNHPVKKVKEIMTPDPIVVPGKTSISQIKEILKRNKIWSILIGDSYKCIGIITQTDLKYRGRRKGSNTPAYAIRSKNVYSIDKEEDVTKAIFLILEKDVNGLTVTSNGILCGVVTRYDILNRYAGDFSTSDKSHDFFSNTINVNILPRRAP